MEHILTMFGKNMFILYIVGLHYGPHEQKWVKETDTEKQCINKTLRL